MLYYRIQSVILSFIQSDIEIVLQVCNFKQSFVFFTVVYTLFSAMQTFV